MDSGNINNCGLSRECDFMQEFMDLEEFLDASTNNVTSPHARGNISPSGRDTSLDTTTSANEEQGLQGQNMDKSLYDPIPHIDDLVQSNLTCSIANDGTQCTTDTSDRHSLLDNGGIKDQRYWDRRVKNNIAAKRSRDAKRLKETTVVKRWTHLEEENKRLKEQILDMQKRLKTATEEVE
ncbi:protein giant-like isoform X2 [Dendronephthya gigantea]|uniref:protein giant-like isoform X2 n=1 Tax=Dendronephthya gigantea TaxID=151771 RepID=UPI00106C604D|nr:protein giant-like isoform X2 [Dendronephthya gigantea]